MIYKKSIFLQILLIVLFFGNAFGAPGEVENLRPDSEHVLNTPSQVSLVEMVWDLPSGYTSVEGYYYTFTTQSTFTFDETNTATLNAIETAYAQKDYTGSNDISIYVYVAAVVYNESTYVDEIGDTTQFGPIRVDTITPDNAGASVDQYINTATADISIGGFGNVGDAVEMYISNSNYETSGEWEGIVSSKAWQIDGSDGRKTIYIRFKDEAENTSDKSISTIYDSTSPSVSITSTSLSFSDYDPITVTITFEDPTPLGANAISGLDTLDFEETDISISNGIIENYTSVSSGSSVTAVYSFTVTPANKADIEIQVLADEIFDQAENGNSASEILVISYVSGANIIAGVPMFDEWGKTLFIVILLGTAIYQLKRRRNVRVPRNHGGQPYTTL